MRLGVLLPHRAVVLQSARRPPLEVCWTVARLCDAAGLDLWVGDSVVAKPRLEPLTTLAYLAAQGFGWSWGKNVRPREAARFSIVYTAVIAVAAIPVALGIDPLSLTNVSMVLSAATLPLAIVPFVFVMNDPSYVKDHGNGWIGNVVVIFCIVLAFVLGIISIPLEIIGGG